MYLQSFNEQVVVICVHLHHSRDGQGPFSGDREYFYSFYRATKFYRKTHGYIFVREIYEILS